MTVTNKLVCLFICNNFSFNVLGVLSSPNGFQWCFKGCKFQGCFKPVLRVFTKSLKGVSRKLLEECFKKVSGKFQGLVSSWDFSEQILLGKIRADLGQLV